MSANEKGKQVGGDHYAHGGELQHWDFVIHNFGPGYLIGCATKYVSRWRNKDGLKDLRKSLHYVEKMREGIRSGLFAGFRGRDRGLSVKRFAQANLLTDEERIICELLSNWDGDETGIGNLDLAEAYIKRMIEKAEAAAEG